MIKTLIAAIFLSQALIASEAGSRSFAPIQDVRVFSERAQHVQYVSEDDIRWLNNIHRRRLSDVAVVVSEDRWYTPKPPIPYWLFWACAFKGQTAQQCVAIHSMLSEELKK